VLIERKLLLYPERIVELFPDEPDLKALGAVSYMGVQRFRSRRGNSWGIWRSLDTKPLPAEPRPHLVV